MSLRSRIARAAACLGFALCACQSAPTAPESPPVASIDGEPITLAQLEDWMRDDLLRRELEGKNANDRYEIRADALDRMIQEKVLSAESERSQLAVDALIERELESMDPVSDARVEAFYTTYETQLRGHTLEEMEPRIREHLESERRDQAVAAIVERANVEVRLQRPRFEVEPDGPSRGPDDARVTIVEFSDFQCPYCQRSVATLRALMNRYPEDVRIVYRHLPLDSIHPRARAAAEAAACAHDQQKFWPYHDLLFANNQKLSDEDLRGYAEQTGLDLARFDSCVKEGSFRDVIDADVAAARRYGIRGTPAFFVNGYLLSGSRSPSDFIALIDAELAAEAEAPAEPGPSGGG